VEVEQEHHVEEAQDAEAGHEDSNRSKSPDLSDDGSKLSQPYAKVGVNPYDISDLTQDRKDICLKSTLKKSSSQLPERPAEDSAGSSLASSTDLRPPVVQRHVQRGKLGVYPAGNQSPTFLQAMEHCSTHLSQQVHNDAPPSMVVFVPAKHESSSFQSPSCPSFFEPGLNPLVARRRMSGSLVTSRHHFRDDSSRILSSVIVQSPRGLKFTNCAAAAGESRSQQARCRSSRSNPTSASFNIYRNGHYAEPDQGHFDFSSHDYSLEAAASCSADGANQSSPLQVQPAPYDSATDGIDPRLAQLRTLHRQSVTDELHSTESPIAQRADPRDNGYPHLQSLDDSMSSSTRQSRPEDQLTQAECRQSCSGFVPLLSRAEESLTLHMKAHGHMPLLPHRLEGSEVPMAASECSFESAKPPSVVNETDHKLARSPNVSKEKEELLESSASSRKRKREDENTSDTRLKPLRLPALNDSQFPPVPETWPHQDFDDKEETIPTSVSKAASLPLPSDSATPRFARGHMGVAIESNLDLHPLGNLLASLSEVRDSKMARVNINDDQSTSGSPIKVGKPSPREEKSTSSSFGLAFDSYNAPKASDAGGDASSEGGPCPWSTGGVENGLSPSASEFLPPFEVTVDSQCEARPRESITSADAVVQDKQPADRLLDGPAAFAASDTCNMDGRVDNKLNGSIQHPQVECAPRLTSEKIDVSVSSHRSEEMALGGSKRLPAMALEVEEQLDQPSGNALMKVITSPRIPTSLMTSSPQRDIVNCESAVEAALGCQVWTLRRPIIGPCEPSQTLSPALTLPPDSQASDDRPDLGRPRYDDDTCAAARLCFAHMSRRQVANVDTATAQSTHFHGLSTAPLKTIDFIRHQNRAVKTYKGSADSGPFDRVHGPADEVDSDSVHYAHTQPPVDGDDESDHCDHTQAADDSSYSSVQFVKSIAQVLPDVTLSSSVLSASARSTDTVLKRRSQKLRNLRSSVRSLLSRATFAQLMHHVSSIC
jgi:hypothetical protein